MRDLFLITGIPGTGKTELGNNLAKNFGFAHYDLEKQQTLDRLAPSPTQFIADTISQKSDTVVTWGFNPEHQLSVALVLQLKTAGFKLIWFDGNRQAALRAFQGRAKSKSSSDAEFYWRMHEFYLQMYRIETSNIIDAIKPTVVDPFDAQGNFKATAVQLEEMRQ